MKRCPDRLLLLGALCLGQAALAQQVLPEITVKKPPPPVPAVELPSVTVSAERPTNRIDRQVYDVKSDANSTNGSAADALANVPSVAVDPDGTVSLRGSTNVQILIDGKPSAMLTGDNRGAMLNAMPADDIESIEVINNPGAQFGNEAGGGPILNLVMRRNRKPGGFGNVNANGGTQGRYNSSVSGSYNEGLYGFQGGVNVRRDGRDWAGESVRDYLDPVTRASRHSTQASRSGEMNDTAGINGTVSYNVGAKDTVQASAAHTKRTNNQRAEDRYVIGLPVVSDFLRTTARTSDNSTSSWGARLDHKGSVDGENLKLDLRVSASDNSTGNAYDTVYSISPLPTPDRRNRQFNISSNRIADFTGDYALPSEKGMLKLGFKVADNKSSFDTRYHNIDPLTAADALDPTRTNLFKLGEGNLAAYGSYEMRLNEKWGVLGGLRAEHTALELEQVTTRIRASNNYTNVIPSLFASYKAGADTIVRFSYAHRLHRPNPGELNPFVIYRDEQNVSSGNPHLKPMQTDSIELGYETRAFGLDTNVRGYYRKDKDAIVERHYFISDTVLLSTRDNLGSKRANGLEFSVSGKIAPGVKINTSGNLARNEQTLFDASGAAVTRRTSSLSLRGQVNWQATEADSLQVSVQRKGGMLTGLGYSVPSSTANFTLRHTLAPTLSALLTVTDVFKSNRMETIYDSDTLKGSSVRRFDGRIVYLGLSYRFGGVTPTRPRHSREGGNP